MTDIESEESMRMLVNEQAIMNPASSSSSPRSNMKIVGAAFIFATAVVMAFSGQSFLSDGTGLKGASPMNLQAISPKIDGSARKVGTNFAVDEIAKGNLVSAEDVTAGAGKESDMIEDGILEKSKELKKEKYEEKQKEKELENYKKSSKFNVDPKAQLAASSHAYTHIPYGAKTQKLAGGATISTSAISVAGAKSAAAGAAKTGTTAPASPLKSAAEVPGVAHISKSPKKLGRKNEMMSVNEDNIPHGFRMMSLAGATAQSSFEECSSNYVHGGPFHYDVDVGCISLFNNDISVQSVSTVITFCGCETIGPKMYDFISLQGAGLISKAGAGLISFIATGMDASLTIYNSPDFTGEEHFVIGPMTQQPCKRMVRGESTWDNAIYSLVMQSWSDCNLPAVVCAPEITQAPIPEPTMNPFIAPTPVPTGAPIIFPTPAPSALPTTGPTKSPRARPTMEPLARPTLFPTMDPTKGPLAQPSQLPTLHPNPEPSHFPTETPINIDPTLMPTMAPTMDERIVICKGNTAAESKIIPGQTYPSAGCASFFWSAMDDLENTMVSTICSCGEVGQVDIPESLMEKVGAASSDGFPTISSIITGYNTSLTIYAPYWTESVKGVDKNVIGPREDADLTNLQRISGSGVWNDKVKYITIMAWNDCTQHLFEDSCIDF